MMSITRTLALATLAIAATAPVVAVANGSTNWARVTVLLETSTDDTHRAEEAVLPAGVFSLDEVRRRGMASIDEEIAARVTHLGTSLTGAEESMRLATLQVRQYYLPLVVGQDAVLPVIDVNPRLGIVVTPKSINKYMVTCRVRFLEPEGEIEKREFNGEPINLSLQDADLRDVLGVFQKLVPVAMEIDPSVEGTVTVDLREVPWDQALDLILRINGLGWVKRGDTLEIAPQHTISNRKRVRTEALVSIPLGGSGGMIASRGDAETPTVIVTFESVEGEPEMVAEKAALLRPVEVTLVPASNEDLGRSVGELAVLRGTVTEEGALVDARVVASPSDEYAERLLEAAGNWRFRPILDKEGVRQRAVAGFGVRFRPARVLASIGAVEHIGAEVSCRPVPDKPGVYVIQARVSDLDTGRVISMPMVFTRAGDEARVRTGIAMPSGEHSEFMMTFLVSEDGKRIRYSWELTSKDKVLSSHSAEFEL
jgi:hypothetical protein